MPITRYSFGAAEPSRNKQRGHTAPEAPLITLDQPGRLRVAHVLALLATSHTSLYQGMKTGRYPRPDGWDGRRPFWRTTTIKSFLDCGGDPSMNSQQVPCVDLRNWDFVAKEAK